MSLKNWFILCVKIGTKRVKPFEREWKLNKNREKNKETNRKESQKVSTEKDTFLKGFVFPVLEYVWNLSVFFINLFASKNKMRKLEIKRLK